MRLFQCIRPCTVSAVGIAVVRRSHVYGISQPRATFLLQPSAEDASLKQQNATFSWQSVTA